MRSALVNWEWYRVSQKKHSYKIFGLEIMLFTCSQTLWSGLRSSFTKWGTAPAFTTACKTTMSASRWRAWSLVQKFYKSVFFWDTLYVLFFVCDFLTFLCFTSSNFQFKVFLPEYSRNLTCLVLLGPGSFFRISLIGSDQLWKFCPICEKSDRGNIRTKEMINKTNRGIISYLQLIFAILDDISFNFIYLTLLNLWI